MKKEINLKLIIAMVIVALVLIGIYVGDYFWVESYKDVPVYYQHIFGHDLARYVIFDHIISAIMILLSIVIINLSIYVEFKKKQ